MSISWETIDDIRDRDAVWAELVSECGYATYFHTPYWAHLMANALGTWAPEPVVIEFSDGNLVVLPISRRLDSTHRESVFPGVYGGPLFRRPPAHDHWDEFDKVPLWFDDAFFVENPYSPYRWLPSGLVGWRDYTHRTDLSVGFDALWRNFRSNLRRNFTKAERGDLSIRLAATRADCAAYYDIYAAAAARFGDGLLSCYPSSVFEGLVDLPGWGTDVQLWLAYDGSEPVSGLVLLKWSGIVIAWHYSTRPESLETNASPLLLVNAIRDACAEGQHWFDFLGSGSMTGVARFKGGFASERSSHRLYWSSELTPATDRTDAGPGAGAECKEQLRNR